MLSEVSSNDKNVLLKIMLFYSLLSYFVFPLIGLYIKKNKDGITHGMILGTVVSIFLWFKFGSNMVQLN
jgi:Na+/proline symporter